jgi:hypothetical protein
MKVSGRATLVSLVIALGVSPGPAAGAAPKAPSLEEVRAGWGESRARLQGLLVENYGRARDPKTGEWEHHGVRRVIAARGKLRRAETYHFDDNFSPDLDIRHDVVYFTGESLNVFCPPQRYLEVTRKLADSPYNLKARCEFYLECTGWWPPGDTGEAPPLWGHPFFLHDALADPHCRVRPLQEQVDGAWCCVVERPGVDTLWLDPALGFMMRRREWLHGHRVAPARDYELSGYRPMGPGIWLPWQVRRVSYKAPGETAGGPPEVAVDTIATVVRAEVNRVSDAEFRWAPLPGTLTRDLDTEHVEQTPGGLTFLDTVMDLARRRAAIYARNRLPALRDRPSPRWPDRAAVAVVAALALVDVVLLVKVAVRLAAARAGAPPAATAIPTPEPAPAPRELAAGPTQPA